MACNGFRLLGGSPPFNPDDTMAKEGDAAHWLAEQVFKGLGTLDSFVDSQAPNGVFITFEMVEYCSRYVNDIVELGGVIEHSTSMETEKWRVGARVDHSALVKQTLYINDLKYGWKIVEPEENWTLLWHASQLARDKLVTEIVFRIYQPRPYHPEGNVREWVISADELQKYEAAILDALTNPQDTTYSGPHCYKCSSRTQCPAAQIAAMNSIDVSEKAFDSVVENDKLGFILDEVTKAIKTLEETKDAYEDLALHRLKAGSIIPNYSVQSDLTNKQWKEGVTPELMQAITGLDLTKKQLITPNQAKKAGANEEVVEALCERRNKGLKLVRVDAAKQAEKLLGKKGNR